jgi:hypothetical protein
MSDMSDTSETAKKFHRIKKQDRQVAPAKVRTSRRVADGAAVDKKAGC